MAGKRKAVKRCRVCPSKAKTRELCDIHRTDAKWMIDNKIVVNGEVTTDEVLVKAGLMAPKQPLGRKPEKKRKKIREKPIEQSPLYLALQGSLATV